MAPEAMTGIGQEELVPAPEVERRQPVQEAGLGPDTRQRTGCAESGRGPRIYPLVRVAHFAARLISDGVTP